LPRNHRFALKAPSAIQSGGSGAIRQIGKRLAVKECPAKNPQTAKILLNVSRAANTTSAYVDVAAAAILFWRDGLPLVSATWSVAYR
jgi:hypothetical protein